MLPSLTATAPLKAADLTKALTDNKVVDAVNAELTKRGMTVTSSAPAVAAVAKEVTTGWKVKPAAKVTF